LPGKAHKGPSRERPETIKILWDPFPNAPAQTPMAPLAKPVTRAQARAISAVLKYLAEKRAAADS
jgi:hypothetical protein